MLRQAQHERFGWRARLLAVLAALLLPLAPARAWWDYGHATVAQIAYASIAPATRRAVDALLARSAALDTPACPARTMAQASVWADCVKTLGDRFSYAYSWHYQDVDICRPFDLVPACRDGNCVVKQIERNARLLADRTLPTRERVMALVFLIHFVGDLHQPLHAGEHDDQGGNAVRAAYGRIEGKRVNLHAIWDGLLAERAISTPPGGARGLLGEVPAGERAALAAGSVEDWSRDSWAAAKDLVYPSVLADPCAHPAPLARMDEATVARLIPAVRFQIAKSGLRLARLLDDALDPAGAPR